MQRLHERFRERADVVFVYIAEAHAVGEWQLQSNLDEEILIEQPRALEDRFAAARAGVARLGLTMPVLVDGLDDAVNEAFSAWPERIYVVTTDGVIAFAGEPGPWEFDPDAAGTALQELLDG